jgi:polyisoprenyl-teichoic acid--peptidoglycan teichoic acid transferase
MPTFQNKDDYKSVSSSKIEPKKSSGFLSKLLTFFILVVIILIGYFSYLVVFTSSQVFQSPKENCTNWFCNFQSGINNVPKFFSPDKPIKGQEEGRTNFLLIGVDNTGASGLTDTIIIASYYHVPKKLVTINIPRDFLVDYRGNQFKINELYQTAEGLSKGTGASELAGFLSKEFEIPMHYWATTNFSGTKELVKTVGDIDINIEKSFTDCEYPDENYGYMACQKFVAGQQQLNPERALIFSRSRHGNNGEGSDFARSKRQSMVIQALLQKVKSQNIVDNALKFSDFMKVLANNVKTSMDVNELKSFYSTIKTTDLQKNFLRVNWAVGNKILCDDNSGEGGYYINYCGNEVAGSKALAGKARYKAKTVVKNLLTEAETLEVTDNSVYIVGNSTKTATKIYTILEDFGFNEIQINNQYTPIPVTPLPEKVSILVRDPNLVSLVKTALDKKIEYTLVTTEPTKFTLPTKSKDANIVIYVE